MSRRREPAPPDSRRIAAVIWDIDDTLVDTAPSYLIGQREAIARLEVEPADEQHALELWNHLFAHFGQADRSSILHAISIELGLAKRDATDLAHLASSVRLSWHVGVTARDGAAECLSLLHAAGSALGIVSNGEPEPQKLKLKQADLSSYFADEAMVFTPAGSPGAKPSATGLLACAQALNVRPGQCCYVGDSPTDMIAANLAGMTAVLVTSTPKSARFAVEQPAHAATDLHQLSRWLADRIRQEDGPPPTRAGRAAGGHLNHLTY
ncbi:phosphoglycolate phosphatase [Dactylosporangium cerinum]